MLPFYFIDGLLFSENKQILSNKCYNFKPSFTLYLILLTIQLTAFITVGGTIKEQEGGICYYVLAVLVTSSKVWITISGTYIYHQAMLRTPVGCPIAQLNSDSLPSNTIKFHNRELSPIRLSLLQTPITSPVCYLYFWSTVSSSEVPTIPSLGWINLLGKLTQFKNPIYH